MSRASARIENLSRHLTSATGRGTLAKVAVLGASGGIGQPLCMLLKTSKFIGEISLYDVANTPGVAADLGHISSPAAVKAFTGPDELPEALRGCSLVLIPAGIPRKPGMTRDDLFNINASIVAGLCQAVARHCPQAWTAIISNPVNSTVPIAAEVFRAAGVDCSSRLFGVTTLDVVRSETFVSEILGEDPRVVTVPVVGGHAGKTILPLLSQANPALPLPEAGVAKVRDRIQNAGTEVVEAKQGAGSATLSMAYAAARFADACLRAQAGQNLTEYAYVQSSLIPGVPFFASKLQLGPMGIVKECGLGTLSPPEQKALQGMVPELKASITKGVVFAHNFLTKAT